MPLTPAQLSVAKILSKNRHEGSRLAVGSAMHFEARSLRYSEDLDYFHDRLELVMESYQKDKESLEAQGYTVETEILTPAYVRAVVSKAKKAATKIEWARDSSWRFMPIQKHPDLGFVLHPIDLCINKLLALVGREEARDYVDVVDTHSTLLPLGAQIWAAASKDPGFSPDSLLELLKRKGRYRPEDFARLHMNINISIDLEELKSTWLNALKEAENFVRSAPPEDVGCLYYSADSQSFIAPDFDLDGWQKKVQKHFGAAGGVLPRLL